MKTPHNNPQPSVMKEPIAIVGMSCRFPYAETLQAFWKILSEHAARNQVRVLSESSDDGEYLPAWLTSS